MRRGAQDTYEVASGRRMGRDSSEAQANFTSSVSAAIKVCHDHASWRGGQQVGWHAIACPQGRVIRARASC